MADPDHSPFVSKSYYSMTGNIPVSSVFHPIYDGAELIGVMGMDINFGPLQQTVAGHRALADGGVGEAYAAQELAEPSGRIEWVLPLSREMLLRLLRELHEGRAGP